MGRYYLGGNRIKDFIHGPTHQLVIPLNQQVRVCSKSAGIVERAEDYRWGSLWN